MNLILVVEDNPSDQFLAKMVIKLFDPEIKVLLAFDGEEALGMLASLKSKPDLLLLDINMPGMDGFEFLEEYCNEFSNCDFPVVILTSSNDSRDKEKASAYSCMKKYMLKPITVDAMESLKSELSL